MKVKETDQTANSGRLRRAIQRLTKLAESDGLEYVAINDIKSSLEGALVWVDDVLKMWKSQGIDKAKKAWAVIQELKKNLLEASQRDESVVVFPVMIPPAEVSQSGHSVRQTGSGFGIILFATSHSIYSYSSSPVSGLGSVRVLARR